MKKLLILCCAVLLSGVAMAQQALWGASPLVSPEINTDNTVTFRYRAPKAVKVQITGDFLPTQKVSTPFGEMDAPGVADLIEGKDGVWEFKTEKPLSPELYSYSLIVDGLRVNDPSNIYQLRDVASITNIFIIGGQRADLYKVNKVPHGAITRRWYHSPSLDMDRRVTIYTPAAYDKNTKERFPVLYLLHGMGGDEEAWATLGRTVQIMDNLIAQGKAKPMLVVMTNGNAAQEAAPGESSIGLQAVNMQMPRTMEGSFETHFPEVVKFVDANYRTIANKQNRAIAGLSMGGFHSMHISKQYPDMFNYVGLFSAAIMPQQGVTSPIYQDLEQKLATQFAKKPALYWIAIGKTDFLFQANVDYRKMLDEKGYKYEYYENEDGHIWKNWRIYLTEFAPMLFQTKK